MTEQFWCDVCVIQRARPNSQLNLRVRLSNFSRELLYNSTGSLYKNVQILRVNSGAADEMCDTLSLCENGQAGSLLSMLCRARHSVDVGARWVITLTLYNVLVHRRRSSVNVRGGATFLPEK